MARKSRLNTKNNSRRRLWLLLVFLLFFGSVAWIGTAYKQQLTNIIDIWRETFPVEALATDNDRGTIYDRNFKELARTLERVSLYVRPREVKDIPETARLLSGVLGLSEPEIIARMDRDSHLVWLRRDIVQDDEDVIAGMNLPGIYLHRELARNYPQQDSASYLIGYSENDLGLAGVEHYYNRLLNHDRVRQEDFPAIDLKGLERTSTKGHDLVLTLDMKIQAILEKHVRSLGETMGGGRISSLVLDTAQGKIIAGAGYPSYNPNNAWQHENEMIESLFLTPMVVPEKIRQFFRDASLLQSGWEQATQVYPWSVVSDKVDFGSQLRLWERLQLTTDIQVDFSGGKKQATTLPQFEGIRPALDLGSVPTTLTPLKVLLGMTHLLNGGKKIQPHILDKILERPDKREYYYDISHGETQGRSVFPSLVSRELQSLLRVQSRRGILGSAVLSGETVSLVMNDLGGSYVRDQMALVAIPAEQPELILLLVAREEKLKNPKSKASGPGLLSDGIDAILPSIVALQQVYRNFADMVEVVESQEQNFKGSKERRPSETKKRIGILETQVPDMPDLTGLSLRKGLNLIQSAEVNVTVRGTGRIVSQSPKAGEKLMKGESCMLILKADAPPKDVMQIKDLQVKESLSN